MIGVSGPWGLSISLGLRLIRVIKLLQRVGEELDPALGGSGQQPVHQAYQVTGLVRFIKSIRYSGD